MFETFERMRLRTAGLERVAVPGPRGPLVYWRGGAGPAVFFLHGANDQAGTWVRVIAPLLDRHRVVLVDLAGHGDSAPADGPLGSRICSTAIEAVVAAESGEAASRSSETHSAAGWRCCTRTGIPIASQQVVLVNGAAIRDDGSGARVNLLPRNRQEAGQALQATMSPASAPVPGFVIDDLVRRAPGSPLARLMAAPPADEFLIDATARRPARSRSR